MAQSILAQSIVGSKSYWLRLAFRPLVTSVTVQIHFLPDDITTTAEPGEALLDVAHRVGVHISTGCLMGSCYACEVEMTSIDTDLDLGVETDPGTSVRACLTAIPDTTHPIEINLLADPTW